MLHKENLVIHNYAEDGGVIQAIKKVCLRKVICQQHTCNDFWRGQETWPCFGWYKRNTVFVFTGSIQSIQVSTLQQVDSLYDIAKPFSSLKDCKFLEGRKYLHSNHYSTNSRLLMISHLNGIFSCLASSCWLNLKCKVKSAEVR